MKKSSKELRKAILFYLLALLMIVLIAHPCLVLPMWPSLALFVIFAGLGINFEMKSFDFHLKELEDKKKIQSPLKKLEQY